MNNSEFSYYGKLPSHGDFLSQNLPPDFIGRWDGWLQKAIANSHEESSEDWLNYYLTSPIWHFILSPGCCDQSTWVGVMMPSVDKVGRYYPFTLFQKIAYTINPMEFINNNQLWFEEKQSILLALLDEQLHIDQLNNAVQQISDPIFKKIRIKQTLTIENSCFSMEQGLNASSLEIMDTLLNYSYPLYSIWHTQGSDNIKPSLLICNELPSLNQYNALLDGQWQKWDWNHVISQ